MKKISLLLIPIISTLFIGCGRDIPSPEQRLSKINSMKLSSKYKSKTIQTSSYKYFSIHNVNKNCENINVYFEGDGLAWITRSRISSNPTPITPTAFKLMLTDISNCSVYMARACQYTNDSLCSKDDWTSHRFSKKIVDSTNEAINSIKSEYKNKTFNMIGYSGGAAIASLVSNKRDDVKTLVTIAGNLNTTLWTDMKNITPLRGSLNPVDYISNLQNVNQYHLIGKDDRVIPKEILESYISNFNDKNKIKSKSIEATHSCCYEEEFRKLINNL